MVMDGDVHRINILQWQLNDYLVGEKIVKDPLTPEIQVFNLINFFSENIQLKTWSLKFKMR